jgi:3-phenylpropionate/trans-cinnamate dioxygenase ferredoxin reductase component
VCYLRDVGDGIRLRARLAAARRVVVIGGGFIGLEVAAVARTLGKTVVVVEAAERLMPRSVAPVVSAFYEKAHLRRGAEIRLGAGVVALRGGAGQVRAVELSDGTAIPADVVVVGVGIVPRTELAAQLGLACDGGIVVDARARTSEPGVVAAGDCTVVAHPGVGRVRLESVPHATAQARVAAATLLGRPEPEGTPVPWFWSDQYDLKLQIAGLADGHDAYVVRDGEGESMSVLYYRDGRLIAVNAVNKVADYLAVRRALAQGASIPADRAADPDTSLVELARTAPQGHS